MNKSRSLSRNLLYSVPKPQLISRSAFRKVANVEPTAVNYRASMKQGVSIEDMEFRVNFRERPYKPASLDESMEYIKSDEFKKLYGDKPVWFHFRRNFKGHFPPKNPRDTCLRGKKLRTSNPCPICRDEFLLLHYKNIELLKTFINPISLDILEPTVTGLCLRQHNTLLLEVEKARDLGKIEIRLPFRLFDYAEYYGDVISREDLFKLSGHVALSTGSGGRLEPRVDIIEAVTDSLAKLPPSLASLLSQSSLIPHVEEVTAEPPPMEIDKPVLPNRYKMEEEYRKLLLRRRRSKSLLLDQSF